MGVAVTGTYLHFPGSVFRAMLMSRIKTVQRWLLWLDTYCLAMVILFVAVFAMAVRALADSDTWWHLQAGRVTLEEWDLCWGTVP